MRMLIGSIFALILAIISITQYKKFGWLNVIMTTITCLIASIIFLGQWIGN